MELQGPLEKRITLKMETKKNGKWLFFKNMFGCLITEPLLPLPLAVLSSATRAETGVKIRHQYYNYSECRQKILLRCRHLGVGLKDVPVVVVVVCPPRKNEIMKWHFPRSAKAYLFLFIAAEKMGNCWADEMGSWLHHFSCCFLWAHCSLFFMDFLTGSQTQKRTAKKYLLPEALNEFPYQEDRRIRTVMKGDEFQQHFSVKNRRRNGICFLETSAERKKLSSW